MSRMWRSYCFDARKLRSVPWNRSKMPSTPKLFVNLKKESSKVNTCLIEILNWEPRINLDLLALWTILGDVNANGTVIPSRGSNTLVAYAIETGISSGTDGPHGSGNSLTVTDRNEAENHGGRVEPKPSQGKFSNTYIDLQAPIYMYKCYPRCKWYISISISFFFFRSICGWTMNPCYRNASLEN